MATQTNHHSTDLSRSALTVGLFSLLAVGSWIGFDLYRSLVKTTLPQVLQSQMASLPTSVDETVIQNLRQRQIVSDETLNQVQSVALEEDAVITISPVPTSTSGATFTATTAGQIEL